MYVYRMLNYQSTTSRKPLLKPYIRQWWTNCSRMNIHEQPHYKVLITGIEQSPQLYCMKKDLLRRELLLSYIESDLQEKQELTYLMPCSTSDRTHLIANASGSFEVPIEKVLFFSKFYYTQHKFPVNATPDLEILCKRQMSANFVLSW